MTDNPFDHNDVDGFYIARGDLNYFNEHPCRMMRTVVIICHSGEAILNTGFRKYLFATDMEILIIPGSILTIESPSDDFEVEYCLFESSLYKEVRLRLGIPFHDYMRTAAPFQHTPTTLAVSSCFMNMFRYIYNDKTNRYRGRIIKNHTQSFFLNIFDKTSQRFENDEPKGYSKPDLIFRRYMALIQENYLRHRDVNFYASELCISSRYLALVTQDIAGRNAKKFIDDYTIMGLKVTILNSDASIQEIAYRYNFTDQSSLTRYFKQHTGVSPTKYRGEN